MRPPAQAPLVAIGGLSGSGKTTIALRLADALGGVPVVHLDDFYTSPDATFNDPGSIDLHAALSRISTERSQGPRAVIVEGLFALTFPAIRQASCLRVYLHAPLDICLARKTLRMVQHGHDPQQSLTRYLQGGRLAYLTNVCRYQHHADVLIDATRPTDEIATILTQRTRTSRV
jgi:uridine kinase